MSQRVYVLMDIAEGKSEEVAQSLAGRQGVVKVDLLEKSPDLILICEAIDRQKLAEFTIKAPATVEKETENVSLLPARNKSANSSI